MNITNSNQDEHTYETVKLQQDKEYRIYLKPNEWIRVWLVHGSAEVFGTELREAKLNDKYGRSYNRNNRNNRNSRHRQSHSKRHKNQHKSSINSKMNDLNNDHVEEMYNLRDSYLFSNCNISIFTYQGCTLYLKFLKSAVEHKFVAKESQYHVYCNYNAALTNMRRCAEIHQVKLQLSSVLSDKPSLPKISADILSNDYSLNEHKIIDIEIIKEITTFGPRVLILGQMNSGKASLAKILANYGLRSGYYPLLIDLDCSINMISIPGTIAAVSINEPIDVEIGFNHSHAPNIPNSKNISRNRNLSKNKNKNNILFNDDIDMKNDNMHNLIGDDNLLREERELDPLIYFYGDDHPDRRLRVYTKCIEKLALSIKKKLILNLENRASGIIIKCHGCINNPNDQMKNTLNNIIKSFHIDTVLCIDDELTLNYLRTKYKSNTNRINYYNWLKNKSVSSSMMDTSLYWKNRFISISTAVKSNGVKQREQSSRLRIGRNIIHSYFYGPYNNYRPLSCEIYPIFLKIYQIGRGETTNDLLPADMRSVVESFSVLSVRHDISLRGQILAILHNDNGIIENEQYAIEKEVNNILNHHNAGVIGVSSAPPINNILRTLIEFDDDNINIMYNSTTGNKISNDPFNNNNRIKNKKIRSSPVKGFIHIQEIKFEQHNKNIMQKITLLNPSSNKLPLKCLLKGHINWHDR